MSVGAGFSYKKFVHFALEQTRHRSTLVPHPSQVLAIPQLRTLVYFLQLPELAMCSRFVH
jgi:hypothetical protein